MLNVPQYPTYDSLPSGSHGDLALVTTGGVGVYKFVGQVNREPVGLWVPADLADRIVDYVRTLIGLVSIGVVDGGSGYAATDTIEPSGGTTDGVYGFDPVITVDTVDGGGAITEATLTYHGTYLAPPSPLAANPMTTVTGSGTGATFNLILQGQGSPCKISVGVGGDLVADLSARGWIPLALGGGNYPSDGASYIELDPSSSTTGQSGLGMAGLEDIGVSPTEYLQITQTDSSATPASPTVATVTSFLKQRDGVKIIRLVYRTDSSENTAEFVSWVGTLVQIGRNSVTFSAYETLFSRWMLAPNPLETNAEINEIWKMSEGRTKTIPNVLTEECGDSGASVNKYRFYAGNLTATLKSIGRVRELHLFKLSQ